MRFHSSVFSVLVKKKKRKKVSSSIFRFVWRFFTLSFALGQANKLSVSYFSSILCCCCFSLPVFLSIVRRLWAKRKHFMHGTDNRSATKVCVTLNDGATATSKRIASFFSLFYLLFVNSLRCFFSAFFSIVALQWICALFIFTDNEMQQRKGHLKSGKKREGERMADLTERKIFTNKWHCSGATAIKMHAERNAVSAISVLVSSSIFLLSFSVFRKRNFVFCQSMLSFLRLLGVQVRNCIRRRTERRTKLCPSDLRWWHSHDFRLLSLLFLQHYLLNGSNDGHHIELVRSGQISMQSSHGFLTKWWHSPKHGYNGLAHR